jgi:hypothetical protein
MAVANSLYQDGDATSRAVCRSSITARLSASG